MEDLLSKYCSMSHSLELTANDSMTHAGTKNVHTPDSHSDSSILMTYVLHSGLIMGSSRAIEWQYQLHGCMGGCSLDQGYLAAVTRHL